MWLFSLLALAASALACGEQPGVSWSERLAVSRIRARHPVSLPSPGTREPADRARVRVCLTIGAAGEVLTVRGECGDAALLAAVMRSVPSWRFQPPKPDPTFGASVTTNLTFQWRDHRAGLIWDRKDYPIREDEATKLVRAVPEVAAELKSDPRLILEIDGYPEERDGIFYLFHLYESGSSMNFTLGWYSVNAYTGEVWDGSQFQPVRAEGVQRLRKAIGKRLGIEASRAARYEALEPWSMGTDGIMNDPCADR